MLKKLLTVSMAVALTAVAATATIEPAQAGGRGVAIGAGIAGGIIGLGLLGAAANAKPYGYGPACYAGPRQCDYVGRRCWYNRFGDYVCGGGEYRCHHPTICN